MGLLRKFSIAAASAALMSLSMASQAALISASTNNPYAFNWSFDTGSSLLTGNGSMTLSGFNSSSLSIAISLTNTSLLGGQGGERLVSFGFGIDPNATAVGFSDANDSAAAALARRNRPLAADSRQPSHPRAQRRPGADLMRADPDPDFRQ